MGLNPQLDLEVCDNCGFVRAAYQSRPRNEQNCPRCQNVFSEVTVTAASSIYENDFDGLAQKIMNLENQIRQMESEKAILASDMLEVKQVVEALKIDLLLEV